MTPTEELTLLGMERVINRAYERATSRNPKRTKEWHDAEIESARRIRAERNRKEAQP